MKNFFAKLAVAIKAHKGRTIAICATAVVLIFAIVALSGFSVYVFNRFSSGYVPTDEDLAVINNDSANQYARVLIIGVDGMGDYVRRMDAGTMPNFDKMFNTEVNASVTHTGMAVYPTISAQNWTSMFHGVRPYYHGINGKNANSDLSAGKQADEKYPSFIKNYLSYHPEDKVISSCTWDAVNNGAIEDLPQVTKINNNTETLKKVIDGTLEIGDPALVEYIKAQTAFDGIADETYAMTDAVTVQRLIDETATTDYKIAYMHLNQVDSAGHSFGFNRQPYIRAVSRVDVLIGKLYEAYEARGWLEDTLFILCTDHGHRYLKDGTGHGGNRDVERTVTFAIAGKTVKPGTPGKYVNTDLAPIVSYALSVKAPSTWQGRVPYNMFTLLG